MESPLNFYENNQAKIIIVHPGNNEVELRVTRGNETFNCRQNMSEFKPDGFTFAVGVQVTRNNCYWH